MIFKQIKNQFHWVPLILVSAFYIFELLPGKGVSLQDESWFLYSAWAMVTPGIPLDTHNPHVTAFVINGILMFLGFKSYYALKVMLCVLILISFFIFFSGVYSRKEKLPGFIPILASISLFGSFHTLISHKNAPVLFLMCGLGIWYHYLKEENARRKIILLVISAICLGLSGLMNITVFPASLLACILLIASNKGTAHKRIYFLVYLSAFFGPLFWYIQKIGIDAFARGTVDHSLSASIQKIPTVILFDIHWLIAYGALFAVGALCEKKGLIKKFDRLKFGLVLMIATISFYILLLTGKTIYGLNLVETLGISWITSFNIDAYLESWKVPMYEYPGSLAFALIWLALLSCYKANEINKRLLMFSFLCFVYFSGQAAASNLMVAYQAIYYCGPILEVSLLFFFINLENSNLSRKSIKWKLFSISLGLVFILGFMVHTNHSYMTAPYWVSKEPINIAKLYGLRDTPLKKAALETMVRLYKDHGCAKKELISIVNNPLPYFLFERKSTGNGSWIHQNRDFYPQIDKIMAAINSSNGSCVFLSMHFEMPHRWDDFEGGQNLKDFLNSNSDYKIMIGPYPKGRYTSLFYVFKPKKEA